MISEKNDVRLTKVSLFFFSAFMFFLPIFGGVVRVNNLYHIASTLILIAFVFRKNVRKFVFEQPVFTCGIVITALMLLWFCMSSLWGNVPAMTGSALKHSFYLLIFIILFSLACWQGQKTRLIALIFAGIVILNILIFILVDKNNLFTTRLDNVFFGEPDNVIDLGGYYAIGIFCGLILIRETGIKWLYLPITLLFIGLLLTQSRGPLFSLCAALLPLLLLFKRQYISHVAIGAGILVLLTLALIFSHVDHILVARIDSSYTQSFTRFGIWQEGLRLIAQKPWFGWGLHQQLDFVNDLGNRVHTTHSLYIAALLKGGIVGFIALLTVTGYGLYMGWQQIKQKQALEACMFLFTLFFYITQGMFLIGNAGETWLLFWLPLAVVFTLPKKS